MGNNTNRGTCGGAMPPVEFNPDALKAAYEAFQKKMGGRELWQRDAVMESLAEAIAALPKQEPSGWRPIESAPKENDKSVIVGFVEPEVRKRPRNSFVGEAEYRTHSRLWWWPNDYDCQIEPQPTHWQPLPDPPKGADR